jgi:hypothetical protein
MDGNNVLPVMQEWRERLDAITCSVRHVAQSSVIRVEKNGVESVHVQKHLTTTAQIRTMNDITMNSTFTMMILMNVNTHFAKNVNIDDQEQKVASYVNVMNAKTLSQAMRGNVMIVTESFASTVIVITTRYMETYNLY